MTARRLMHAAGGAVHFTYPPEWSVRAYHGLDLLEFYPLTDRSVYGPGIAALISAETGSALEAILPLGLFLLTRDLRAPRIAHDGWQADAQRAWYHLRVDGRVQVPTQGNGWEELHVLKRVAVCRPGPFVLTLALFGPEALLDGLLPAFATFRDALQIVD